MLQLTFAAKVLGIVEVTTFVLAIDAIVYVPVVDFADVVPLVECCAPEPPFVFSVNSARTAPPPPPCFPAAEDVVADARRFGEAGMPGAGCDAAAAAAAARDMATVGNADTC